MEVTYTYGSSYLISIPTTTTVGTDATVSASNVVLHKDETLSVSVSSTQYADNSWQLKNGDNFIPYTIKANDTPLANNDTVLTAQSGENPSVTLSTALAEPSKPLSYAGAYTDTLVFAVDVGIDLGQLTETYVIRDSGTYTFTGYTYEFGIKVESGDPTIKLVNAYISNPDGNGIDVVGGNATIHVTGKNSINGSSGLAFGSPERSGSAGIYVALENTVTITGNSRADVLHASGCFGSAGIGGYAIDSYKSASCGNITIKNVTVTASGSAYEDREGILAAGIGASGKASCGTITIDNATITAEGGSNSDSGAPAIGNGGYSDMYPGEYPSISDIIIQNYSEVHAKRGHERSDYIGYAYVPNGDSPANGAVLATIDETSHVWKEEF